LVDLKLLLKRGALLAAANWPTVAIQFAAQSAFKLLLVIPLVAAAMLAVTLVGGDLAALLQGGVREMFASVAAALIAAPVALAAFVAAFMLVLTGGSVFMFLVKGGTVTVLIAAHDEAGSIEREPLTLHRLQSASRFTLDRFVGGCSHLFGRYVVLGLTLMAVYALSAAAYVGFIAVGYRAATGGVWTIAWTFAAAAAAILLVVWITAVNLIYLLAQIAIASADATVSDALRAVARFIHAEFRDLGQIFLVVLAMVVAASLASAVAWSGVALIAFVPVVGVAVIPLQLAALVVRGVLFEYIGLTALGAYVTAYRRYTIAVEQEAGRAPIGRRAGAVSAWG
jgi:hypothetical protein